MKGRRIIGAALAHLSLIAICALTLYPVLIVIKTALSASPALGLGGSPLPTDVTLDNFLVSGTKPGL